MPQPSAQPTNTRNTAPQLQVPVPGGPINVTDEMIAAHAHLRAVAKAYQNENPDEKALQHAALSFTHAFDTANPGRYSSDDEHHQEFMYRLEFEEIEKGRPVRETTRLADARNHLFETLEGIDLFTEHPIYWGFIDASRYQTSVLLAGYV